eukprot:11164169-Lingulodinium_polyedra.AAC.1
MAPQGAQFLLRGEVRGWKVTFASDVLVFVRKSGPEDGARRARVVERLDSREVGQRSVAWAMAEA